MNARPAIVAAVALALAALAACSNEVSVRGITKKAATTPAALAPTTIAGRLELASDPGNTKAVALAGGNLVVGSRPDSKAQSDATGAFSLVVTAAPVAVTTVPAKTVAVGAFGLAGSETVTVYATITVDGVTYGGRVADVPVTEHQTTNVGVLPLTPTGYLKGIVTLDGQTAHGGSEVSLPSLGLTASSDDTGAFVLTGVPEGAWRVRYEHAGFLAADSPSVQVVTGLTTQLDPVALFAAAGVAATVTVNGGLPTAATRTVGVTIAASTTATLMMTSVSPDFLAADWQELKSSFTFTFPADGSQTLYVKIADGTGAVSPVYSATVVVNDRDGDGTLDAADCDPDGKDHWQMLAYAFRDADGDGYYAAQTGTVCAGAELPAGYAATVDDAHKDCDDGDAAKWTLAKAATDFDGDGHGGATVFVCKGDGLPAGYAEAADDCDDTDAAVFRMASGYKDGDGDGFGDGAQKALCTGAALPAGVVAAGGDEFAADPLRHGYGAAYAFGSTAAETLAAMARDGAGNAFLWGTFAAAAGGIDLDFTAGTHAAVKAAGGRDAFVTKMTAAGGFGWSYVLDAGTEPLDAGGVATDSAGNVYVTGSFAATAGAPLDFDAGAGAASHASHDAGGSPTGDAFVLKLKPDGSFDAVLTFGGVPDQNLVARRYAAAKVVVGPDDSVYVAGVFPDSSALDAALTAEVPTTSDGTGDGWAAYLMKLDASLNQVWVHSWGFGEEHTVTGLAVDADGNLFVAGQFKGTADFDFGAGTHTVTSGGTDAYVMKVGADGTHLRTQTLAATGASRVAVLALAVDGDGNLVAAGGFHGDADLDPGSGTDWRHSLDPAGDDLFVLKLSPAGERLWSYQAGGLYQDRVLALAADAQNAVYLAGVIGYGDAPNAGGTVDFAAGAEDGQLATHGDGNAFVAKLAADGSFQWAKAVGASSVQAHACDDQASALSVTNGAVLAGGVFGCSADFDVTGGSDFKANQGAADVFVLRL